MSSSPRTTSSLRRVRSLLPSCTVLLAAAVLLLVASSSGVRAQCSSPIGGEVIWSFPSLPAIEFTLTTASPYFQLEAHDLGRNVTVLQSLREQPSSGNPGQAPLSAGLWKGIYQNIYTGYMLRVGYTSDYSYASTFISASCPGSDIAQFEYAATRVNDSVRMDWTITVTISVVAAPIGTTQAANIFQVQTETNLPFEYTDDELNWRFPFVSQSWETKDVLGGGIKAAAQRTTTLQGESDHVPSFRGGHSFFEHTFSSQAEFETAMVAFRSVTELSQEEEASPKRREAIDAWMRTLEIGEKMRLEIINAPAEEQELESPVDDDRSLAELVSGAYEQFYGHGQRWGFSMYRGEKFYSWSEDGSWAFLNMSYRLPKPNATYIPMPLFYSRYPVAQGADSFYLQDYAVWVNESARVNWIMGGLKPSELGPQAGQDAWSVATEWNSSTTIFVFPIVNGINDAIEGEAVHIQDDNTPAPAEDPYSEFVRAHQRHTRTRATQAAQRKSSSLSGIDDVTFALPSFLVLTALRNQGSNALIPSPWIFGVWKQTGNVLANSTEQQVIQLMQKWDIPITVRIGSLHFFPTGDEQGHEAELTAENAQYHALGVKTLAYFNAMVSTKYESMFNASIAGGYFLANHSGLPYLFAYAGDIITRHFFVAEFDFANPAANEFYKEQIGRSVAIGYDGFMYDFGEYVQVNSQDINGVNGNINHNLWIEEYQRSAWEFNQIQQAERVQQIKEIREQYTQDAALLRSPTALDSLEVLDLFPPSRYDRTSPALLKAMKKDYTADLAIYTRSGYTRSALYGPLHWTGDASADWNVYSGLPGQLQAALGLGVSGVPFSSSPIGGYVCDLYPDLTTELMMRWVQVGCFSGFMHDETEGSACSPKRVQLFSNEDTMYGWRKYGKLRTQMFAYTYTAAHEAHLTGLPIQRHHILTTRDPQASDMKYQFMFGADLLVAPALAENQTEVNVYLPWGSTWYDLGTTVAYDGDWNNTQDPEANTGRFRIGYSPILTGGQTVVAPAALHQVPLFVRSGSIIPLIDPSVNTLVSTVSTPSAQTSFTSMLDSLHLWVFPDDVGQASGYMYDGSTWEMQPQACYADEKAEEHHQPRVILTEDSVETLAAPAGASVSSSSFCLLLNSTSPTRLTYFQVLLPSTSTVTYLGAPGGGSPFTQSSQWEVLVASEPQTPINGWVYDPKQQVLWIATIAGTQMVEVTVQTPTKA